MITIPCEHKLSPKCTGSRRVKKRYLKMVKNNACKPCANILAQQKQSISRPARQSKEDLPVEKEIRNPLCDHYNKCLARAAFDDSRIVGCGSCEREVYTPGTLGVFPVMDPDKYCALPPGLWREIKQGGG